jgi:hypothetical protein
LQLDGTTGDMTNNSNLFMKKEKAERINKELYATTSFFNNKMHEDPYNFLQADKERREKHKMSTKKETPAITITTADKDDKKSKMKVLQKKYI